ncbi:MAG: B3/4 domain-containing protein [Lachnospiraceae bacterium]|jgi:DNA/RNA-binding domain of Phe-tRNA-synthetase-like protein
MHEIAIDRNLFSVYPEIRLGSLQFCAEVKPSDDAFWNTLDQNEIPAVRERISGKEWSEIPGVRGSRLAYKAFGRNPGRYRVSSEALLRRIRRGDELYHVNSVVDVNNLISIRSGLSVGFYDLDKIQGPIVLRKAESGEGYEGIGKDFLDMENILVLADDSSIFGSSMSDSKRTMVTVSTRNVLAVIYCFERQSDLGKTVEEARDAFIGFTGAQNVQTRIL